MKHFKTISEFHQFRQLNKPEHPLISVIDVQTVKYLQDEEPMNLMLDFYCIAIKRMSNAKVKYGQQPFDFNEGVMSFMSPNQVFSIALDKKDEELKQSGWVLFIHPDFLWNTSLVKIIQNYDFGIILLTKPYSFLQRRSCHRQHHSQYPARILFQH